MVLTDTMQETYTIGTWAAGGTDDAGCRWSVPTTDLRNGTGRKTHITERPFGTGAYRSRSYLAGRSMSLQGWCMPTVEPSWPLLVAARRRFMGLFPEGSQQLLVVDDGVLPRQITVELAEAGRKWDWWPANGGADWQLDLYAADPRWLSTVERSASATLATVAADGLDWENGGLDWGNGGLDWGSSSGNNILTMVNDGSATAWPLLTITTPSTLQNPTITDPITGGLLAYTGTIAAGQTLRIDCSPFSATPVTLDGIDRTGALGSSRFISIPPGSTRAVQFTGVGAGTVVATWRDADE
ncbi:phage distal tail protein [Amycolatopsis echigonensis]|uniref:Phage tail family protein n=1 Tax=Amycolatopsis echigonensis TaxID=2576905 RepID=A0A8E1W538_9PSEU|nr:phage tail domain-containing protein [Amycolatopsis echigonensis]MBB2504325.1 phage tail family protein [Amycolatopsis echigonensis]